MPHNPIDPVQVSQALAGRTFTLGTRGSQLALWQANHVAGVLRDRWSGFQVRLREFVTTGDRTLDRPLPEIGGKGLFTEELETALRAGEIDLVVHSLKDLPVEDAPGLVISAIPQREDPRDVLIAARPLDLENLPQGARVGTSSLRRSAQLLAVRPDLTLLPVRGNVDTRIRKVLEGQYDAIILAAAGVTRLGLTEHVRQRLPFGLMLPAPGQGALAVQCRADDDLTRLLLAAIDDSATRQAVTAERAFLSGLGGGCSAPVAALGEVGGGVIHLIGLVASVDGSRLVQVSRAGSDPHALGAVLARAALEAGAGELLAAAKENR
jgi:hydroxymethylbilane synthase